MKICAFCKKLREICGVTRGDQHICMECAEKHHFCEVCGSIALAGQQQHFEDECFK